MPKQPLSALFISCTSCTCCAGPAPQKHPQHINAGIKWKAACAAQYPRSLENSKSQADYGANKPSAAPADSGQQQNLQSLCRLSRHPSSSATAAADRSVLHRHQILIRAGQYNSTTEAQMQQQSALGMVSAKRVADTIHQTSFREHQLRQNTALISLRLPPLQLLSLPSQLPLLLLQLLLVLMVLLSHPMAMLLRASTIPLLLLFKPKQLLRHVIKQLQLPDPVLQLPACMKLSCERW